MTIEEQVAEACQHYHIKRLELFGSAVGDAQNAKDYDFLVEFGEESRGRMLADFLGLAESLEKALGKPVDLVTPRSLKNPYFRQTVMDRKRLVYERKDR